MLQKTDQTDTTLPPGLVYASSEEPGITRRRRGRGFSYHLPDGGLLNCRIERARIQALGVPPAWSQVWICALPNGHLQATGHDERGRRQYRYHARWSEWRSQAKFGQLAAFGEGLGRLRRRVARDLETEAGEKAFALAALVTLLDRAGLRVGNPAYESQNRTYGATTLLKRHLDADGGAIRLSYRAKGGRKVSHTLKGPRLQRIFQEIDDLPGRRLFTWVGEDGEAHPLGSAQVNAYIAEASGVPEATAKTFRTWSGSVAAFDAARSDPDGITIKAMSEAAASRLHNTPAICRSSYVHPAIIGLAGLDSAERARRLDAGEASGADLKTAERRLLAFLNSERRRS
ncbi:DNA topoisomerase IB [Glycocaulis profundi]|nr:DNA topoisomerase IB [Glycocaulis profundi]